MYIYIYIYVYICIYIYIYICVYIYIYIFFLIIHFLILLCIFREEHLLLELGRTIINCEFSIYIVSFIIILAVSLVHCLCISSLLIYVDRLFDFMFVSKYGSSSGRAVGPTFKLGPTRICVCLEYSGRSSIDDEIGYIYIVWYFKSSFLVSRPPGSGWARELTRSACWSMTAERRGVWCQRNVQHEHAERIWMSSAPTNVRPLERPGQVSIRWETGAMYWHIERTGQLERGRRLTRVNETERGIHQRPLVPSCICCT